MYGLDVNPNQDSNNIPGSFHTRFTPSPPKGRLHGNTGNHTKMDSKLTDDEEAPRKRLRTHSQKVKTSMFASLPAILTSQPRPALTLPASLYSDFIVVSLSFWKKEMHTFCSAISLLCLQMNQCRQSIFLCREGPHCILSFEVYRNLCFCKCFKTCFLYHVFVTRSYQSHSCFNFTSIGWRIKKINREGVPFPEVLCASKDGYTLGEYWLGQQKPGDIWALCTVTCPTEASLTSGFC